MTDYEKMTGLQLEVADAKARENLSEAWTTRRMIMQERERRARNNFKTACGHSLVTCHTGRCFRPDAYPRADLIVRDLARLDEPLHDEWITCTLCEFPNGAHAVDCVWLRARAYAASQDARVDANPE